MLSNLRFFRYSILKLYTVSNYVRNVLTRRCLQLDDALSATRLEDGRIKVWIHVADPTSLVQPRSVLDKYSL